jgi:CubicO group peptidase (beta-lactamase class C family)
VDELTGSIDRLVAETQFSGVVRIDDGDDIAFARAYGLSNRAHGLPNTLDTQFGIASGVKGLTALTVVSLIEDRQIEPGTTARSVLGRDLPLIADDVTIEHLLAHRSGIGDYLDEDTGYDIDDYMMPVPVHELRTTEEYVRALDGYPQKFPPGDRFSYCNGGYVVLALIAERVAGIPFYDLVAQRVCGPAGMRDSAFLESDTLPGRAAIGYLETDPGRTNVFHLPVRGNGDGGIYSTAADVHALWHALFDGRVVSEEWVARMVRPHSDVPSESRRYGLGFWLHASENTVMLVGYDAGVSFHTAHDPTRQITYTVVSNTAPGAWPIVRALEDALTG